MQHHHNVPVPGNWYDSKGLLESFTVVDYDFDEYEHTDYVNIQYLHGEIDRLDIDTWDALNPEEIAEPEDATAPYGIEHDQDILKLLNEIEGQQDLDEHVRNIDSDEEEWE